MASVMLQAMACGSTVISSEVNGARDIITNGRNGYVVPIDDAGAMASCIQALQIPQTRCALRAAALANVRRFSWTALAADLEQIYLRDVLDQHPSN